MSIYRSLMKAAALCLFIFFFSNANAENKDSTMRAKDSIYKLNSPKAIIPDTVAKSKNGTTAIPAKPIISDTVVKSMNGIIAVPAKAVPAMNIFPKDTLQHFIKTYGKDSLLKLMDQKILVAKNNILKNINRLNDPLVTLQIQLLNKHFKLGYAPEIYNVDTRPWFMKLYGINSANPQNYIDTVIRAEIPADSFYRTFGQALPDRFARIGFAGIGQYLNVPPSWLDTLYGYAKRESNLEKIELYHVLSEYSNNNPGKNTNAATNKNKLFDSLYRVNDIPSIIDQDTAFTKKEFNGYLAPMTLLAYGLYGNNITLKKNGRDVMYAIALQHEEGGWSIYTESKEEIVISIYGLWVLLEARNKLVEY